MTVFEYLQTLPQDLFEATLMGLMGVPMDETAENAFHDWMNKPASDYFPNVDEVGAMDTPTIISEIGKVIKKMDDADKETLRRSLIGYCEVCDKINQQLVDEQQQKGDDARYFIEKMDVANKGCVNSYRLMRTKDGKTDFTDVVIDVPKNRIDQIGGGIL